MLDVVESRDKAAARNRDCHSKKGIFVATYLLCLLLSTAMEAKD
jgi:hypothetical protein